MSSLRIFGIFLSILFYFLIFFLFNKKKVKKNIVILFTLFVTFLLAVSVYPNFASILPYLFDIKKSRNYRLIALLIMSSLFGWFFIFYLLNKIVKVKDKLNDFFDQLAILNFENHFGKDFKFSNIVVIIPAYNEEKSIGTVLSDMPKKVNNLDLNTLVVVDGGNDGTYDVVDSLGTPVARTIVNRGGGLTLRLGYKLALKHGAKIIVTMDADGQHDPNEIADILAPIINSEADFVVGSRILGNAKNTPFLRKIGILVFSRIISLLTFTRLTDCSNGFRAIKSDGLNKLLLKEEQYYSPELLIEAARNGLIIKEVPITVHERTHGVSKKGRDLMYGIKFAKTILKTILRGKK